MTTDQGPATPGTAARCEDDLDLIASALGLTPYQGSNNRTIHDAEEAVSRLRVLVGRARAETLNEAAKEVDLVAAEYIGQAGEAEFDPNWIAGESLQGAAERIRSLIPAGDGPEGPRAAPSEAVPEIERLKAENASLLESLRAAEKEAAKHEDCIAEMRKDFDEALDGQLDRAEAAEGEVSVLNALLSPERKELAARAAAAEQRAEAAEKRSTDLMEARDQARRLFWLYGQHSATCRQSPGGNGPCTCAFQEAWAALHDEERPQIKTAGIPPAGKEQYGSTSEVQGPQRQGLAGLDAASGAGGDEPGLQRQRREQVVLRSDAERLDQPDHPEPGRGTVVQAEHGSVRGLLGGPLTGASGSTDDEERSAPPPEEKTPTCLNCGKEIATGWVLVQLNDGRLGLLCEQCRPDSSRAEPRAAAPEALSLDDAAGITDVIRGTAQGEEK